MRERNVTIETLEWLNKQVLVGYGKRPWHYNEAIQASMGESNLYDGPIPKEDVIRRLFDWELEERPVYVGSDKGPQVVPSRTAIVRSDTGDVFGIFTTKYKIHRYEDWLLSKVADIVDNSEIGISSAGLLKRGAVAFVTIQTPENVTTRSGMEVRPMILATTSHDGTLATTYKPVATLVVCDNTLSMALAEGGKLQKVSKTKHSKLSIGRLESVREAMGILIASGETIVDFLDSLADVTITDSEWEEILLGKWPDRASDANKVRAKLANSRSRVDNLYRNDERCAPWSGTALGAFQAMNTYRLHVAGETRTEFDRFEKNSLELLGSQGLKADRADLALILGKGVAPVASGV
jgi:phage/plasmid-like protein (TIGR03299 family)